MGNLITLDGGEFIEKIDDTRLDSESDKRLRVAAVNTGRALVSYARVGFVMLEARRRYAGHFVEWLDERTTVGKSTIYRWMKLAANWEEIEPLIDDRTSLNKALEFISEPDSPKDDGYGEAPPDEEEGGSWSHVVNEAPDEDYEQDETEYLEGSQTIDESPASWREGAIANLDESLQEMIEKGKLTLTDRELTELLKYDHLNQCGIIRDVKAGLEKSILHACGAKRRVNTEGRIEGRKKAQETIKKNKRKKGTAKIEKDRHGRELPNNRLKEVFRNKKFKESQDALRLFKKKVSQIRGDASQFLEMSNIDDLVGQIDSILTNAKPMYVCPRCSGEGEDCEICRNSGWVPAYRYSEYQMSRKSK